MKTPDYLQTIESVREPKVVDVPDEQSYQDAKRKASICLARMSASTVKTYTALIQSLSKQVKPVAPQTKSSTRGERVALQGFQLVGLARCKNLPNFLEACSSLGWSANEIIASVPANRW
jgi:hypothetical protein